MALLELRNTPTQDTGTSPVQRLYNRRTRTALPMSGKLLQPRTSGADMERLSKSKARQKQVHDRNAKDLPVLE